MITKTKKKLIISSILIIVLALSFFAALCFGAEKISFDSVFGRGDKFDNIILWNIRLPRALLVLLTGILLGGSGAVFQLFFQNPLAEPGIMGISSGATLGAVIATLGTGFTTSKLISSVNLSAFFGALLAGLFVTALAFNKSRKNSSIMLLLCGTALGTLYSSPTSNFPVRFSDGEWGDDTNVNPACNINMMGSDLRKTFQGTYEMELTQKLDFITEGLKVGAKVSYTSSSTSTTQSSRNAASGEAYRTFVRYHRDFDYANPIYGPNGTITYNQLTNLRLPFDTTIDKPVFANSFDSLSGYSRRLYYEFSLNWARKFGEHEFSALGLMNRQIYDEKSGNNIRFPSYNEDWVGRVTYNWKQRYMAEANISYTGSEKFARGMRFGLFPSLSIGWRFSEEPWIKNIMGDFLSDGKIRYSWGKVGSDIGASRWNYVQSFTSGGNRCEDALHGIRRRCIQRSRRTDMGTCGSGSKSGIYRGT